MRTWWRSKKAGCECVNTNTEQQVPVCNGTCRAECTITPSGKDCACHSGTDVTSKAATILPATTRRNMSPDGHLIPERAAWVDCVTSSFPADTSCNRKEISNGTNRCNTIVSSSNT